MEPKRIIDFHTHIFPTRVAPLAVMNLANQAKATPFFDGRVDGLIQNMNEFHVDYSVCMPVITNIRHTKSINDYAIEVNKTQNKIISFGGIHPLDEGYKEEIHRLKENNIIGIKLHPVYQGVPVDDERTIQVIDYAISQGLYVLIHAGLDPGFPGNEFSSVKHMVNMLDQVKDTSKIILAHLGGLFEWEESFEMIAGRDLYLDTAMSFNYLIHSDGTKDFLIDNQLFLKMLQKHGSDKILMGSDNPWTPVQDTIEYILRLPIPEDEKENILYKNASKILGLE